MITKIKLVLVDDHQLIITGLQQIFSNHSDLEILQTFTDARMALAYLQENEIDILVTDLDMPNFTGIDLIKEIRKIKPKQKIIVLSMIDQASIINRMIKYDINGFLLKNDAQTELPDAIRKVANGEIYYNKEIRSLLFTQEPEHPISKKRIPRLSRREKEVLQLILQEKTTPEIAQELFISKGTVISHRRHILSKLGAKNIAGVVRIALENGLI